MRVYAAGHQGMVGSAINRKLLVHSITPITASSSELDLTDQNAVRKFMRDVKPEVVVLAAANVGGILANNNYPAQFIYENWMIEGQLLTQRL